ncbi:PilN domain-containing protein [Photobacterium galatheae]|uniref:MSHA biogenesis protein MshI n=1 Tax=Photobacterium galatheae TaxID=1654360 RepID=A0A066RZK0_9GAMM|nr:PilN domain-containing protein [Photobacterium galatheae]KDM92808.1 MSHA biogenesis protein MshI [Photobacterium galatheae]MCM0149275.1 PilN domain-containing protein [Photobacterium galatheae]
MLIKKFLKRKTVSKVASFAVFENKLTLVSQSEHGSDWIHDSRELGSRDHWVQALDSLIVQHQLAGSRIRFVLGHGLYQSLTIDKPALPRQELASALPFLVKDLVSEPPANLVADGYDEPLKNRLQVFVTERKQIQRLVLASLALGCEPELITADEVVLGELTDANQSQLVLHGRLQSGLQLTAFKQQIMCFQRQLRGFRQPLMGDETSSLQMDGLALELQRSLDFLSAQLRDMPIAQVLVSCDSEDDTLLADALRQRLSVPVVAVSKAPSGLADYDARVAWAALAHQPLLNLYHDSLKPQSRWLTLPNLAASWAIGGVLLASFAGWQSWQEYRVSAQLAQEQARLSQKQTELETAKAALARHLPSELKVKLSGDLAQRLAAKQATLKAIAMHDKSLQAGFASLLRQLAQAASPDISVNRIHLQGDKLDLEGVARTPNAVPNWLQGFSHYPQLTNRGFEVMSLGRNEQNIVTFKLHAQRRDEEQP